MISGAFLAAADKAERACRLRLVVLDFADDFEGEVIGPRRDRCGPRFFHGDAHRSSSMIIANISHDVRLVRPLVLIYLF
jgi:hypothetical protein